jgi:D-cysteine desulfhydrase
MSDLPNPPFELAATPTPIQRLTELSADREADLYIKRDDMTASIAQGNKIRKLEYLLGEAVDESADVVVTCGGVQSNHCRATAVLARQVGLDSYLLLSGEVPDTYDGNLLLDELVGAEIEFLIDFDGDWEQAFADATDTLEAHGRTPYVVPLGGSNPVGACGYVRGYEEIHEYAEREGISFDTICTATGSGGTQAGLLSGAVHHDDDVDVRGINVTAYDDREIRETILECVDGVNDLTDGYASHDAVADRINIVSGYLGPGYGDPAPADVETIIEIGRREGIVLDTCYTGKAFRAFLEESLPGETNLFIHTGGSYGLFPQRERLTDALRK